MKFTASKDGIKRTTVRVSLRLTKGVMAVLTREIKDQDVTMKDYLLGLLQEALWNDLCEANDRHSPEDYQNGG